MITEANHSKTEVFDVSSVAAPPAIQQEYNGAETTTWNSRVCSVSSNHWKNGFIYFLLDLFHYKIIAIINTKIKMWRTVQTTHIHKQLFLTRSTQQECLHLNKSAVKQIRKKPKLNSSSERCNNDNTKDGTSVSNFFKQNYLTIPAGIFAFFPLPSDHYPSGRGRSSHTWNSCSFHRFQNFKRFKRCPQISFEHFKYSKCYSRNWLSV